MAKKARRRAEGDHTIAKRYKLRASAVSAIGACGSTHGSIGRAIQVATELLALRKKPLSIKSDESPLVGKTYKLTPRTVGMIDKLIAQYGTRGNVLAACAQLLASME